jgi:PmbA protein
VQFLDGLYDVDAETFGVDRAVDMALEMLGSARGYDPRVSIDAGSLAVEYGTKAISTSKGIRASERSSLFFCLILGMAVDGDAVSSFDFQFDSAHALSEIDAIGTGKKLAENVIASLGAVKGESFRGSVILAPKAMAEVVSYPIESAVRAASVQKGTSKFCEKMGEKVASPLVSVCDDASLPNGFSTTSFDREGLAPTVTPLIERGILRNYLYDSYTARKDGRQSSGHARGGSRSVPSVGTTNVVYSAGDTSLADMISDTDRGILVTRYSGNVDPISGDFSGVVKGGRMIGGGTLGQPLCGTMIAGNTFDLLTSVSSVSVERERLFNVVAPYVRIDDVTVTSG